MASNCTTGLLCCCKRAQADKRDERAVEMLALLPVNEKLKLEMLKNQEILKEIWSTLKFRTERRH